MERCLLCIPIFCVISHYVFKYQNWTRLGTEPVTVPYLALPKLTPMAASQMTLQHEL